MTAPYLMSIATFGRVFDVHPAHDALTLEELGETLSRFQLKTVLVRREERELEKAKKAYTTRLAGEVPSGPMGKRFERHAAKHPATPDGLAAALAHLEKDIRREAKQDLRLWAPALFSPGARREDENVVHLSALVLDFDKGPGPERLREVFAHVFHIAHSTWSHTPEVPKLRLVLPLSAPVRPSDFEAIWHYANGLAGEVADPTGRALARAWALPAVPTPERERLAWTHPGPLFDPFTLGLAAAPEPTPPHAPTLVSFARRDAAETYLAPNVLIEPPEGAPEVLGETFDPWDGGAVPASSHEQRAQPLQVFAEPAEARPVAPSEGRPAPAPPALAAPDEGTDRSRIAALQTRVEALEARLAAVEKLLSDYL